MADEKRVRIGIPRALFFYDYYPFCKYFFEGLGAKVVLSRKTDREIMQNGLKHSINEFCIPIKALYAHTLDLKGRVDYIFLPYVITFDKKTFMCPKLIGSPDIIRNSVDGIKLLSAEIDFNNFYSSLYGSLKEVLTKINANPIKIYSVYNEAISKQKQFERFREEGMLFEEALSSLENKKYAKRNIGKIHIAVVGHPYIINDDYISAQLIKKLNKKNVRVSTSDMVSMETINSELKILEKTPHWMMSNRVLGAALSYSKRKDVDGIIYITPFGCSPDSLMKENMITHIGNKKPLLTITVDEHTGDAGIITRIEAFLDMISWKCKKKNSSLNGFFNVNELISKKKE
jgi:predicted nucleotide-binding protein (sugar kinase/HSP70/actin superfamily)